jgi:hypothetical protein
VIRWLFAGGFRWPFFFHIAAGVECPLTSGIHQTEGEADSHAESSQQIMEIPFPSDLCRSIASDEFR